MVLRLHYGTPLASNAGSTLMRPPTLSNTLMGVAALRSNRSRAMALKMLIIGGLSKILRSEQV